MAGITTQIDTPESIAAHYKKRERILIPLAVVISVAMLLGALLSFYFALLADSRQARLEVLERELDRMVKEFNKPLPPENQKLTAPTK
jgi:hypothetical protein